MKGNNGPNIKNDIADLEREELFELARRSKEGDLQAREQLFFSHLDQVNYLVSQYEDRGVDHDDLFQDACYGLIIAIDRFDPNRGVLLKTYANSWIKKMLKSAILKQNKYTPIIPKEDIFYDLQKVNRAIWELNKEFGRPPTNSEIAEKTNFSLGRIDNLQKYSYTFSSLDAGGPHKLLDRSDVNCFYTLIPKNKLLPSAEEEVLKTLHEIDLPGQEIRLTKREEEVLCRKLGFNETGEEEPFRVISEATGWSMETVRTDFHNAIHKLRSYAEKHDSELPTLPKENSLSEDT